MAELFPTIRYATGLLGRGSEVLGFDDSMSTDHDWSARSLVMISDEDADAVESVRDGLIARIPETFDGVATKVEVASLSAYVDGQLGLDPAAGWSAADWLSVAEHRLAAFTAGSVFHDEIGFDEVRERLSYYPNDVWLYLLASSWWRLHPEMNLIGRTGAVGDDLGSRVMAAELADELMRMAFLIERSYAPYRKWFGTAFSRLAIAPRLEPILGDVLRAESWQDREKALNAAYRIVAEYFDGLGLVDSRPLDDVRLWDRPFAVPWTDYPTALLAKITDPHVESLVRSWPPGCGVDKVRNTLWVSRWRPAVRALVGYH